MRVLRAYERGKTLSSSRGSLATARPSPHCESRHPRGARDRHEDAAAAAEMKNGIAHNLFNIINLYVIYYYFI